jgi:hypothetical protein
MKNSNIKILFCALLFTAVCNTLFGQSLVVKGRFLSGHEKTTTAYYTLLCNDSIIRTGTESKIRLDLPLNEQYVLIISKIGCKNRVIKFSTITDELDKEFSLDFDVLLKEIPVRKRHRSVVENSNILIYFDEVTNNFCCATDNRKLEQY